MRDIKQTNGRLPVPVPVGLVNLRIVFEARSVSLKMMPNCQTPKLALNQYQATQSIFGFIEDGDLHGRVLQHLGLFKN